MPKSTDRTVVPPIKRFCSARNVQSVGSAWRGIGRTIPVGLMLCRRYTALFLRNSRSWGSRPRLTFCRRHAACSGGDACSQGLRPRLTFSSPLQGLFALIAASETRREWFLRSIVMGGPKSDIRNRDTGLRTSGAVTGNGADVSPLFSTCTILVSVRGANAKRAAPGDAIRASRRPGRGAAGFWRLLSRGGALRACPWLPLLRASGAVTRNGASMSSLFSTRAILVF